MSSDSSAPLTMSAICNRPPGLRTRAISAKARSFSGTRFQDAVRDHDVDGSIVERKTRCVSLEHFDVRQPALAGARSCAFAHFGGYVDADCAAGRSDVSRSQQQIRAGAGPDVDHACADRQWLDGVGIPNPSKGMGHGCRQRRELRDVVTKHGGGVIRSPMEVVRAVGSYGDPRVHGLHFAAQFHTVEIDRTDQSHSYLQRPAV